MPLLNLPSVLTPLAGGQHAIALNGATVGEAVDHAGTLFPALVPRLRDANGAPYPWVTIYVNDEDIRLLDGFATPVAAADEISVVPAVAGG